ncbi:MAG: glycosyltransferase family 39 protein [Vulcanimicrobiaceae bacterium]
MDAREKPWTRRDTFALLVVVLGAFAIRLAFVLYVRPTPVSDFGWYYARALDIVHGLGYTVHGYETAYWPPGWPYFLAGVVWLFGPSVVAAEILQSILNAMTAGIVFLIGRTIFGRASGIAGGVAYALLPSAVERSANLASEPLYTFLWALATYIWVSHSTRKLGWFALSGIVLGAAALVRPSALLFWVILLIYLLTLKSERKHPAQIAAVVAVTAFSTILVVAPWIMRDYRVFGTLVIISNNGGISLYQANNPRTNAAYFELDNAQIGKLIHDPRTEVLGDRLASQYAMQYIKTHPLQVLWLSIRKVKALYSRDDSVITATIRSLDPPVSERVARRVFILNTAAYYLLMLCALLGIVLCLVKRRGDAENPGWRLVLGMILYNTAIFSVFGGIDRFRYPSMPYFAVFAGFGIVSALAYLRNGLAVRAQATPEASNNMV